MVFHWLDVPERVKYKLGMIMRRCLNGTAPQYLSAHCVPVSATASRHHLRSAASHQLVVPSYRLSSYGRLALPVRRHGTLYRNSCVILSTPPPCLHVYWRHFFSLSTSVYSALLAGFSVMMRYINWRFTYLLMIGCWIFYDKWESSSYESCIYSEVRYSQNVSRHKIFRTNLLTSGQL